MPLKLSVTGQTAPSQTETRAADRLAAVRAAARTGRAAPLAALLAEDRDPLVREAALTGLARLADAEAVAALAGVARSADCALRNAAIETLACIGESAIDGLAPLIADSDPQSRIAALTVLERIGAPRCAELALELALHDAHANVCVAAVEVVAASGAPEMAAALQTVPARFPDNAFLSFAVRAAVRQMG